MTEPCPCGDIRGNCRVGVAHACTHPSLTERWINGKRDYSYPGLPLQDGHRVDGSYGILNEVHIEYWKKRALAAEQREQNYDKHIGCDYD